MGLAPPGSLGDLGSFVLGDHPLELDHQLVFGRLGPRALDEPDLGAGAGELVDQQRLVGVPAGEPIRRVTQHDIDRNLGGQIP